MTGTALATITPTATKPWLLDHSHRCDGCGARAYVNITLASGAGDLYFCHHHWNQHKKVLRPKCMYVCDETAQLFEAVKDDRHYIEGKEASLPPRQKQPWEKP